MLKYLTMSAVLLASMNFANAEEHKGALGISADDAVVHEDVMVMDKAEHGENAEENTAEEMEESK